MGSALAAPAPPSPSHSLPAADVSAVALVFVILPWVFVTSHAYIRHSHTGHSTALCMFKCVQYHDQFPFISAVYPHWCAQLFYSLSFLYPFVHITYSVIRYLGCYQLLLNYKYTTVGPLTYL